MIVYIKRYLLLTLLFSIIFPNQELIYLRSPDAILDRIEKCASSDDRNELYETLTDSQLIIVSQLVNESTRDHIYYGLGRQILSRISVNNNDQLLLSIKNNNNPKYDYLAFWVVNSSVKKFDPPFLFELYGESMTKLNIIRNIPLDTRLMILVTSNTIINELIQKSKADNATVANHITRLLEILQNEDENSELRRAAIKGLESLNYDNHKSILLRIVQENSNHVDIPLIRATMIALSKLRVKEAVPYIVEIGRTTDNEYIYSSAMLALGRLGGTESLKGIIGYQRFSNGYTMVAVKKMYKEVLDILMHGEGSQLTNAILATDFINDGFELNKKESLSDDFTNVVFHKKDILVSILNRTNNNNQRILVLTRLYPIIDKKEAEKILKTIENIDGLNNEVKILNTIINRVDNIKTQGSNIPINLQNDRNLTHQEYGDSGYRVNGWEPAGLGWLGHTGLMAGMDSGHNKRIIEVSGFTYVVHHNYWSSMQENSDPNLDYWGAFTLNHSQYYMDFNKRRNVMDIAIELVGADINYPLAPTIDALRHVNDPGTYVSTSEITHLRCDGLVEYCYEWPLYYVWGANDSNHDISETANVEEHNDFYNDPYDPDTELAPIVQCGLAGGSSTHMDWSAQTDIPTYSASYTQNTNNFTISITATDRSGIHYIGYKFQGEPDWSYTDPQPQHPSSDSYTFTFSEAIADPTVLYFWAIDNGGNFPSTAESITINFNPVTISGYVRDGNNAGIEGATVTFSNNGGTATTNTSGYYSEAVDYGWSGTATPTLTGWSFNPSNEAYTNVTSDITDENYTGTHAPVTISGYVHDSNNNGVLGVLVDFSNNGGTATTNTSGYYSEAVDYGWSGTATPSFVEWSFNPSNETYTNVTSDITDENYTGTHAPVTISGYVLDSNNNGISGVTVNFSDGINDMTTVSGFYSEQLNYQWSGYIVPSYESYVFLPDTIFVDNVLVDTQIEHFVGVYLNTLLNNPLPTIFSVAPNYPNPFNPQTKIKFGLPENSFVKITVYDILGHEVAQLRSTQMNAGYHTVRWNGKNNNGDMVGAGMYFYQIIAGDFIDTKKMVLLK